MDPNDKLPAVDQGIAEAKAEQEVLAQKISDLVHGQAFVMIIHDKLDETQLCMFTNLDYDSGIAMLDTALNSFEQDDDGIDWGDDDDNTEAG